MIFRRNTMVDLKMRNLAICLGGVMLLVASSVLAQSGFDKGASAYKRGDYATALTIFRPLAENGDAKSQSILALMYSYGEGVPVDYREAARWYRRAAEQNSNVAQYNLGMLYLEGKGLSQDTDKAIDWLTRAADGGHFRARSELAKLDAGSYSNLTSTPSDSLEAPPNAMAESEPRSIVMKKPVPPPPDPAVTTKAARTIAVSTAAAPTSAPTQTNNHTPVNDNAESTMPEPQPVAGNNGVYRVQLAASRSEEYIRRDWSSYQQRHSDIFASLDASVERAEIGEEKTVWYRLRVGPFASEASAKELCEKLSARGIKTGCLPLRATR
jgi:cell division septation protein DedD